MAILRLLSVCFARVSKAAVVMRGQGQLEGILFHTQYLFHIPNSKKPSPALNCRCEARICFLQVFSLSSILALAIGRCGGGGGETDLGLQNLALSPLLYLERNGIFRLKTKDALFNALPSFPPESHFYYRPGTNLEYRVPFTAPQLLPAPKSGREEN